MKTGCNEAVIADRYEQDQRAFGSPVRLATQRVLETADRAFALVGAGEGFFPVNDPNRVIIDNWDLSRVKQYLCRKAHDPADVLALEVEYRRYLVMRALNPGVEIPISDVVDDMWHAHILFTADYRRLQEMVGPLDHKPFLSENDRLRLEPAYHENTLPIYERTFGSPAPANMWPKNGVCCCD